MALFHRNDSDDHLHRESDAKPVRATKKSESHLPVTLLIIALASLATLLCYRVFIKKFNGGLHTSVLLRLQQQFPASTVKIGRVTVDGPERIVVSNIRLASKRSGAQRPIISIQSAVLHGDLDIANFIQQTTQLKHLDLYGMHVEVWPTDGEHWSIENIKLKSNLDSPTPTMAIHDATVRLYSDATAAAKVIAVHDIQGEIKPAQAGAPNSRILKLDFQCRSTGLLKDTVLRGVLDPVSKSWKVEGAIDSLRFSPKLLELLPPQLSQYFTQLSGLECRASSHFVVSSAQGQVRERDVADAPVSFEFQGRISDGRLRDPRLPYPLENLNADFFCKNQMLQIRTMQATSGDAELELNCDILGFGRDVPMDIHAKATNLEMDSRLRESLPMNLQAQWDRLQPSGRVSGEIRLSFDGARWTPTAWLHCDNVAIRPWLFPYPIAQLKGQLRYQQGTLSSEQLVGSAGGQPVSGSFSLSRSGDEWFGWLDTQSSGAIAIDEPLIAALTPVGKPTTGVEQFIRSLHAGGAVQLVKARFERTSVDDPVWHRDIDLNVLSGNIRYEQFPYPIHEIQGRIAGQDNNWWLHRFSGSKGSGSITCTGNWSTGVTSDVPFDLRFEATAVQIEQELQNALTQDVQYVWDELQPSGSIDRVEVQLSKRPSEALVTRVTIEERSDSNQATGRSLQIQPKNFQVWLTDIDCNIAYEPGRVVIHNASGVNGDSRLSILGECRPQLDGRWLADIQWQPRTRLIVDGQLLRALPKSMRDSLVKIDFRGPLGILGRSQILTSNQPGRPFHTAWDCSFDAENGQLGDGRVFSGLRGTIQSAGVSDGTRLRAAGSVALDALTVHGIPVTRLRGPYLIDDNKLYFGSDVPSEYAAGPNNQMTADALTGKLSVNGTGRLTDGKLALEANLKDAELSGLLRDVGVERASTQAQCNAELSFSGIPWNTNTWTGDGQINLTDAKLFQLPFMMRLLGAASVNADDDSAFQTADIPFEIDGDKIKLQVNCDGEVLRLRGEGWTNLRRDINLELYSYVGRGPIQSVVSPLLSESRYATFMMIEVRGTLDNPIMQRRPFPQLEATLQQIFPEVAERRRMSGLVPWR